MPHFPTGIPIASAKSVKDGYLDLSDSNHTSAEAFSSLSDKDRPAVGDILIIKDGTIGRCSLVADNVPFCINQSVSVVWLKTCDLNREYMLICARAHQTQKFIRDHLKGTAIKYLSITDFAKCPIPIPAKHEQTEIVCRVQQLFAFADQIEQRVKDAQTRVNHLTQSILAKAFRGELTAEWREQNPDLISGENSAKALLERIKAERANTAPKKRTRKK